MKTLIKNYTFDPVAKTVQFSDKRITLDTLLVITNVTDNIIIYNFAAAAKGGTMSGSTLTLTYDTSTMSTTDTLQIFADIDDGTQNILQRILQMLMAPLGYDKSIQRQRGTVIVESGTISTVTAVTTVTGVTAVTSLNNLDGYNARMQILDNNRTAWAQCVRSRIS
jgi:hypothetical protein